MSVLPDFAAARFNMIESQLRPNNVTDQRILDAMGRIPRENFVPSTLAGIAYADANTPITTDRFLMQPMVLAALLQAAEIKENDHVLELAPGTGYSTLVLAALSTSVVSVEPDAILHKEVERSVALQAPGKALVLAGAPIEMCVKHAPFDVIFINGSVDYLPEIIFDQLSEGGRLVTVVMTSNEARAAHIGQARLYRKTKGEITWAVLFEAHSELVPGFTMPPSFAF